jgi:WD40 repeat protein
VKVLHPFDGEEKGLMGYKFKAFISYSHSADHRFAPALQRALERFAKPWHERRAIRIFRDQSDLSLTPEVWPTIRQAIADSEYFLLLASPLARQSKWVDRELKCWLSNRSLDHLLLVLTNGELVWDEQRGGFDPDRSTALPPALIDVFESEPLFCDFRWAQRSEFQDLSSENYADAVGTIAATLNGVEKSAIVGQDLAEHKKTLRLARSAVIGLATLAGIAVTAAIIANHQRLVAQQRMRDVMAHDLSSAAISLRDSQLDLAALLAIQANLIAPSSATRNAELLVLQTQPALLAYLRHEAAVNSLLFNRDGRVLVSGSQDGTLRLWDVTEHKLLKQDNVSGWIDNLALTSKDDLLAVATGNNEVEVWDLGHWRKTRTLRLDPLPSGGGAAPIARVAFNGNGGLLATAARTSRVQIWNPLTGELLCELPDAGEVKDIAFRSDGRTLAVYSGGRVTLWDGNSGQLKQGPVGPTNPLNPYSMALSPDGRTVALPGKENIELWDLDHRQKIRELSPAAVEAAYLSMAFSPDGRLFAAAGMTEKIRLWDTITGKLISIDLQGHGSPSKMETKCVRFSPDSRLLASSGGDDAAKLWDVTMGSRVGRVLAGHTDKVQNVRFSRDGKTLVSASYDQTIRLWNLGDRTFRGRVLDTLASRVRALAFSLDGKLLAAGTDTEIRLYDTLTWQLNGQPLIGHSLSVRALAFSPDSQILASGSADKSIILWRVLTGKPIGDPLIAPLAQSGYIYSVDFSPKGDILASSGGGQAGTVIFWDVTRRQMVMSKSWYSGSIRAVQFNPDGSLLASAGGDSTIKFFDIKKGILTIAPLSGHIGTIQSLVFSPDGKTLATASSDKTVRLWDVETGEPIGAPLEGHTAGVNSVSFSADGNLLASGGDDNSVWIWNLRSDIWQSELYKLANRELSDEEWRQYSGTAIPYQACKNVASGGAAPASQF